MSQKPEYVDQGAWDAARKISDPYMSNTEAIARAIMTAKAEEREAIKALLASDAPHSPRRYIYDSSPDRRIWACDQIDAAIDAMGEPTEAMEEAGNEAPSRNEAHNVEGDYATTARQANGPYRSFRSQPMTRFPYAGEAIKEKLAYIKKLQHSLAYFRSVPAHQRAAEHADEGEHDCITLLRAVGVETP